MKPLFIAALLASAPSFASSVAARQGPLAPDPVQRPWTLMVYGAADNNADGPILEFLDGLRVALDDDPGMELVLFIDRSEGFSQDSRSLGEDFTGARLYRLGRERAERLEAEDYFPGMAADEPYEVDSADPENLARFVAFAKERFPARRYGLMIYSHADGCTMCPDEESGRSMSIPELTDWVGEEASVDLLALELCNMAGLEIAYQWRPGNGGFSAEVLVAIPNAGPPLDWDRAFARLRSPGHAPWRPERMQGLGDVVDPTHMDARAFGNLVVEEGSRGREQMAQRYPDEVGHEAAGCFDLERVAAAKEALDRLAVELARSDAKEVFEELRGPGPQGVVMNYVRDNLAERPYVDVYALMQRALACESLTPAARDLAREAAQAIDRVVLSSFGMDALVGFEPGRHGLFLTFPDGDAPGGRLGRALWSNFGWYTPLEREVESAPYGRWSFLADGAVPGNGEVETWFELLDTWFDDASSDPGGWNRYAP